MNETDLYGVSGVRSGDRVSIASNVGDGVALSVSDPNLRDRIIEFIEDHSDELADRILEELGLTNDEEDYDRYDPRGDLD